MTEEQTQQNEPARMESRSGGYFAKKEAKEKEIQSKQFKRKSRKALVRGVVFVVIAASIWGIWNLFQGSIVPEVVGDFYPAQTRDHIPVGAEHPPYNSNPPTGGWHYDQPAQSGIYDTEIADGQAIHNLEHQHVWITYHPEMVDEATIENLANVAKSYGSKIIVSPRSANNQPIALVAWEYLLTLDEFDEEKIRGFMGAHRGKTGPENIPDFGFGDFRE